ncbi:MAG: PcfJ domain-containing protein [Thermoguttaceae bacterium]
MLLRAGEALHGKNLRKASWQEIAERITQSGRHQSILWERLVGASTREDALRVLRIARKISQTKAKNSKGQRHPTRRELTNQGGAEIYWDYCLHDDYWDYADPDHEGMWAVPGDIGEVTRFNLEQSLREVMTRIWDPAPPLFSLQWATEAVSGRNAAAAEAPVHQPVRGVAIEKLLAEHVDNVMSFAKNATALRFLIAESIGDARNLNVLKSLKSDSEYPHLAICLFSPFWVRSPLTWKQGDEISLLDHLFVEHDVPAFLYSEWFREPVPRFKWLCWFILIARGASLKRAAGLFQWNIPRRFQHLLLDAPCDASPTEACIFTEIKRLGGSEADFRRIVANPAFVIDPTEISAVESHAEFWRETVAWLIAHGHDINDAESERILAWAMHEYTESERVRYDGGPPFTWKGRSVRAVLERSAEYLRPQNCCSCRSYRWVGHGWDWAPDNPSLCKWSFVELTSGEDLFEEGDAMHHCVACYAGRCVSGHSAIVSVRCGESRCVTVEINPRTKQVVQANGLCNRQATPEEQTAIGLWLKAVVDLDATEETTISRD